MTLSFMLERVMVGEHTENKPSDVTDGLTSTDKGEGMIVCRSRRKVL